MRAVFITGARWLLLGVVLLWLTVTLWPPSLPEPARLWLVERLTAQLGQPLQLARVQLRWGSGLPRLRLEQLALLSADATAPPLLDLDALELELDVWTSVQRRALRFAEVMLIGADLVITRTDAGAWQIHGLEHWHSSDSQALGDFLHHGRLTLHDSAIRLQLAPEFGAQQLSAVQLDFANQGARHQLRFSANLHLTDTAPAPAAPLQLQFTAQLTGPAATPSAWSGQGHLRVAGGERLQQPLPASLHPLTRLDITQPQLDSSVTIVDGRLASASVQADLAELRLTEQLTVRQVRTQARLHALADGWQLRMTDLELKAGDMALAGLNLELALTATGRVQRVAGRVPGVDVAALRSLLKRSAWPLSKSLTPILAQQPHGQMQDLAWNWARPDPAAPPRWKLTARGVDLGWQRSATLPEVAGLDLQLTAHQDGGWLRLDTHALDLNWQPLFDRPLHIERLSGQLTWTRPAAGGWQLRARHLHLNNADLAAEARFDLDGSPDGAAPQLDLSVALESGRVAAVRSYLPVSVLSPKLVAWLERALVSGQITHGDLQFRGTPAQFPFHAAPGDFALNLAFADTQLAYHPAWPALTAAAGQVQFRDQGLTIEVERGQVFDSTVNDGRVEIADLHAAERLQIHAETHGPFTDGQRALTQTPLAAALGQLAERFTVGGQAQLSLDLDVPLHDTQPLGLNGVVRWPTPAQFGLRGTALQLTDLGGALRFNAHGLEASTITAKLGSEPITLKLAQQKTGVHLTWRCTRLDLNAWQDWSVGLDQAPAQRNASGLAGLELDIQHVHLAGRTLNAVKLQGTPTAHGWELNVTARELAGQIRAAHPPSGRPLTLNLERLNLKPLLARAATDAPSSAAPVAATELPTLDLHVERLDWGGQRLGTLTLALQRDALGMRVPQVQLRTPGLLTLDGTGEWRHTRDHNASRLELTLATQQVSRLLSTFDEPAAIEAKTARAHLRLRWADAPHRFTWARASGQLDLDIHDGRLLDVEPGIGRLLGMVDIGSLGRRLVLDFSDLHQQGFAFEQFSGQIAIQQGQARLDKMRIVGPAATVRITGSADLSRQQLNQRVLIEPRLGSSVAIASAVAGGPVVGAAVYLVDRLSGNTLDRLGRYEYQITGPWQQPTWTRLGWEPLNGLGIAPPATASDAQPARAPSPLLDDH